jgi:hypothetical protein
MQADTVRQGGIQSDYWRSEEFRCLSKSDCVRGYLEPLSLD